MSVLDRLPFGAAMRMIRDARDAQVQAKAAQRTGGSSTRSYFSETSQQFDWTGRLDTPVQAVGTGGCELRITLEAERVEYPLADIIVEFYVSSNGTSWQRYLFNDSRVYNTFLLGADRPDEERPRAVVYSVAMIGQTNTWMAVKVVGVSNDHLSISVERVF